MNINKKKNFKFISLYNTFTEKEKKEFRKFLKSSYISNGRNYDQILDEIKTNEHDEIKIKSIRSSITIWNRFSELQHLAENFMIQKSFESKSLASKYLLMKEYEMRDLFSPFQKIYNSLEKEITYKQKTDYDTDLMNAIEKLYIVNLKSVSTAKQFAPKLEKFNKSRLEIMVVEMLEYIIEMWIQRTTKQFNINTFAKEIFESVDFKKALSVLSKYSYSKTGRQPLIKFLHYLFLSINDLRDNTYFNKAKKIFLNDLKSISPEKREKYFSYLIYSGIEKFNIGIRKVGKDLFFLINKRLKEGFTEDLKNKDLAFNSFRNYLYIALSMKKFRWINDFVKNYGQLMHPEVRNYFVKMGNAILMFETKDFKACKELLAQVKRNNPFSFVDVSILKLKVLFEMNMLDECHDEIKKFREYLRKERKVQDLLIVYAREFCKAYLLLLKLRHNPVEKNFTEIQFLLENKLLIGKKWILQKADDISQGKIVN